VRTILNNIKKFEFVTLGTRNKLRTPGISVCVNFFKAAILDKT
jgi:hypothetical protein